MNIIVRYILVLLLIITQHSLPAQIAEPDGQCPLVETLVADIYKKIILECVGFDKLARANSEQELRESVTTFNNLHTINKTFAFHTGALLSTPLETLTSFSKSMQTLSALQLSLKEVFLQKKRKIFFSDLKKILLDSHSYGLGMCADDVKSLILIKKDSLDNLTLDEAEKIVNEILEWYFLHPDILTLLFKRNYANVDHVITQKEVPGVPGRTGLMVSCAYDKIELAKLFLEHKANPNLQYNGKTALMITAEVFPDEEKPGIMKLLLQGGANVNMQDYEGNTALMYYLNHNYRCRKSHFYLYAKRIKLLLQYGADVNIENNKGETPLINATAMQKKVLCPNSE